MSDGQQKAAELRSHAALCFKLAQRMSVRENHDRMMEMAQRFLDLAQNEDGNGAAFSGPAQNEDAKSE